MTRRDPIQWPDVKLTAFGSAFADGKARFSSRTRGGRADDPKVTSAVADFLEGRGTQIECARRHGCSPRSIAHRIKKEGIVHDRSRVRKKSCAPESESA